VPVPFNCVCVIKAGRKAPAVKSQAFTGSTMNTLAEPALELLSTGTLDCEWRTMPSMFHGPPSLVAVQAVRPIALWAMQRGSFIGTAAATRAGGKLASREVVAKRLPEPGCPAAMSFGGRR
jgi:hypothetical protein